ncbi:CU044_5270 family protein [Actinomadura violacea]|uniref:CU044_5270 family protein n=1 Tax=Actinomadura violacea TaxID=2819934 RepID=A0ABS3S1U8_9ACTN|nr:CU044_5270 family protein [Actinomadura violacea]MBO2462979.1 CU044_5270 family protein [Actinomadura violacea]
MNDLDGLLAAANPVRADDLEYGEREEAVLRSITARPRGGRSPRWRPGWALPGAAAALAAVAAVALVVWNAVTPEPIPKQRYVTSGPAHAVLMAAAEKADRTEPKRFWHAKGEVGQLIQRDHRGHRYTLLASFPTETWLPRDRADGFGVYSNDIGGVRLRPLTPADARQYRLDGSPQPNENADAGIVIPDVPEGPRPEDRIFEGDPARLPADPVRLRTAMLTWIRDHGGLPKDPDAWLFREAPKLLSDPVEQPSQALRAAVYRMLAGLPGVRNLGTVRDPLGRPALGVAMDETSRDLGTLQWQLMLSPSEDFLMASRAVVVRPGTANSRVPAGSAQYYTVQRTAGWTDTPPAQKLPGARR